LKSKNVLAGLCFIAIFFIAINLIPKSDKTYYEFGKYKKTINAPLSGLVTRIIEGKNFYGAQIGSDSNNYYGFTYQVERTPKNWISDYPDDFILIGDSIKKKAASDSFVVKRGNVQWTYLLPRDLKTRK
jgi:hypothetical protein